MAKHKEMEQLSLACMRGKVGDWFYYVALMPYKEIAKRVKLPNEIDKKYNDENLKLGDWIQRKIEDRRIDPIVEYISKQKQQFFNSLVLGIYDGKPTWQDLSVSNTSVYNEGEDEKQFDYYDKTFGILTLDGSESIFAIDGQHRAIGIRRAVSERKGDATDEVPVIFVGHSTGDEGKIRTRRLFSTLNRYAKPVSESEKIALSEDDNCAIITRKLIEDHKLLKGRILVNKNRSVHPNQTEYFTSIMVLYDLVRAILVEKKVSGAGQVGGRKGVTYLHVRSSEVDRDYRIISKLFSEVIRKIPSLKEFFINGKPIDRNDFKTSILFRPIGQNIFFDVLKVGIARGKKEAVIDYFKKVDWTFDNPVWHAIFWDPETNTIVTDKMRQRFVTILILDKLGFRVTRTANDKKIQKAFGITPNQI